MLHDDTEKQIMAEAHQERLRDPDRSRECLEHILADFFQGVGFQDGLYLDMGAGQWDWGEMIRDRGGKCVGMDKDPAVLELGDHKGFEYIEFDMRQLFTFGSMREFYGIFNKFSFNAAWFGDDQKKHEGFVGAIEELLKPKGWAWLAPWNGKEKCSEIALEYQRQSMVDQGYDVYELTDEQARYYGIHGKVANCPVYLKNLEAWK